MKNFLIAFTVFLVWSFFGLWLYSWFQNKDTPAISKVELIENDFSDSTENAIEEVKNKEKVLDNNLVIDSLAVDTLSPAITNTDIATEKVIGLKGSNSEGVVIFVFTEGISIIKNSSEIFIPESIADFKYKTNTYLIENPNKEVHINSLYSAEENFESPNLGIKRAEKVRDILLEVGIPKEKIVIKPIIKSIGFNEEGFYNNSIAIVFKPLDLARIEELKTRIPDKKILYPRFSTSGILINNNLRNLLTEIKQAVAENPEVRVELVGHTDNIGNDQDNYKMGLNYAKQVEWYVVAKGGIKNSMIKATSRGETEPIDTNNSERGRIANRRVEVIFY